MELKKPQQAIDEIKSACRLFFPDCDVILFGSRAREDYSFDSDYDFLIIIPEDISVKHKRASKAKIRKILAQKKIPVDVLIQSKKEIEIKKNIIGHIVKQALSEGVEI